MLTKELEREVRGRQVKYCDRFNSTHAIDGAIRVLLKEETIMGEVPGGRRTGSENHHRGDVFPTINGWDRNRSGREERTKVFSEGSRDG
jgi:hypothetical protein